MKIAIGGDHAGFNYKSRLKTMLKQRDHIVADFGPTTDRSSVDYPDHVHPLAQSIVEGENELGILICGSANGVAITANKYATIRAAVCWNTELAELARQHNAANIICIPARFLAYEYVEIIISKFLQTPFEGGRHQRRVSKING